MLLKNRRQVDFLGGHSLGIMQHGKQHMMFQAARIRLYTLQNTRVKRMQKVAVAQEKTNNFRSALENAAGLGIGAKPQTPDGLQYTRPGFTAHLRAGIQHARNCSYAYPCGARNIANGLLPWNYFHAGSRFSRLSHLSSVFREPRNSRSVRQSNTPFGV